MRILITGGAGLVGTNLAKFYSQDHEIFVVDNLERASLLGASPSLGKRIFNMHYLRDRGIEVHDLDISRASSWNEIDKLFKYVDVIFHMAAFVGVGASYKKPDRAFEINNYGTYLMLEKARRWGSKVIYPSTFKVYGITGQWYMKDGRWHWKDADWEQNGYPIDVFQSGARSPYGAAKYAAEILCQEYARSYDVPMGIFRMSNIYGPHQVSFEEQGWLTWFIICSLKSKSINIFGDGFQVRDLLYVDDLVDAYDKFMKSDIQFGIWNIGGGPENILSINEGYMLIEEEMDKRFPFITYHDWRKSDLRIYTSDIQKVKKDLNWAPTVSPIEGIRKMVNWVKSTTSIW